MNPKDPKSGIGKIRGEFELNLTKTHDVGGLRRQGIAPQKVGTWKMAPKCHQGAQRADRRLGPCPANEGGLCTKAALVRNVAARNMLCESHTQRVPRKRVYDY